MSGIVEKVKDTLHIGKHHHGHHTQEEGYAEGPGGSTAVTMGGTNTKATSHKSGTDCATGECHKNYEQQGKHVPWEDAQDKTKMASEEAHRAEVMACKAHKHLDTVAESQQEAEAARSRLTQLESEMEGLRTRGVDLSGKQREIEVARRAADEAATRAREARTAKEAAEREAVLKERHAAEAHHGLDEKHRDLRSIEEDLAQLHRARTDAQKQHDELAVQLRDFDSGHSNKQAEIDRLNRELEGHADAVKEAELALATVRERHTKAHTHLGNLRGEHDRHLKDREGLYSRGTAVRTHLEDIKKREAELQELVRRRRSALGEHETTARSAAQAAEAERARAADAGRNVDPLAREAREKRAFVSEAERAAAEAAEAKRAEEQRANAIAGQLERQRHTTHTAVTETRSRVDDYNRYKEEAKAANMRKEGLWDEAKHLGSVGDKNADRKIANMEERLQGVDMSGNSKATTHTTTKRTTMVQEE